ncbi:MAG: glycoside hydrolase family 78 protein [Oscillospiraceae bacterium]|nr:glycoside hydrolase family 78 protein [Oscillospiraceae bacterium]
MFENINFIKADIPFIREFSREKSPCSMFRRKFNIKNPKHAKVSVCGLGYGYYYINGKKITDDLFTAPVSDYNKTLWYNTYDVTEFLQGGENIFTVICGNGFFNESLKTAWLHYQASWRDNPKFILQLDADGETVLTSDNNWKCTADTPIIFNQLRSGEHFDSRMYNPDFNKFDFDDSGWSYAITDDNSPKGIFRQCECQPICECAEYKTKQIIKTDEKKYIFDIGQNISGYIKLTVNSQNGKPGDEFIIKYAEQLNEDNTLKYNGMDGEHFYPESEFMTDKFIANGKDFTWSPIFTYHGFRYIEITGIENPGFDTVTGIFVHQHIKTISDFECSDETLNKLYKIGIMATYSNLFYMPTDCPTREKLGWANDAQASAEQMLINFDIAPLFKKWNFDIQDAMRDDGSMPGIIPTSGWGYEWGNGPVSDGIIFEIPYKIYLYTGDKSLLIDNLPYFDRYIEYLKTRHGENGMINFGLNDWAAPDFKTETPVELINTAFLVKFLRIAKLAANFADNSILEEKYARECEEAEKLFKNNYINKDGTCKINEQTAVSMAIYYKLYDDDSFTPLKEQLKKLVEDNNFHHNCGMVGLRRLYIALNKCGLAEYAYKIITSTGYPSYSKWLEGDATTLWETWQPGNSKNHHMYSDFMSWIIKTLAGINIASVSENAPAYKRVTINPEFISAIDFCRGYTDTPRGRISVEWKRDNNRKIILEVDIPEKITAVYNGSVLNPGKNIFNI